jgi:PAS domain S-box-containing protein
MRNWEKSWQSGGGQKGSCGRPRKELEKEIEKRTGELSKTIEFLKQEISDHMQAEEALRESEEKYRSLFQESRDAVYITTHDGAFVEVNQSYLDLFGYARTDIANLKVQNTYIDIDDRSRFQDEIEKNGSLRNFRVRLRRKDGTEMNCLPLLCERRRRGVFWATTALYAR